MKSHTLTLCTIACCLSGLVPQLGWASSTTIDPGTKQLKLCNNGSTTVWANVSATAEGQPEYHWWPNIQITPGLCVSKTVPQERWNAGRAYIYGSDPANMNYPYRSDADFQLVEFTFRNPNGSGGTLGKGIGYNFSGVDSISSHIPLGMEASLGNLKSVPYTGINMGTTESGWDSTSLTTAFQDLINHGWSYFTNASQTDPAKGKIYYKIPGGYNLFAETGTDIQLNYQPDSKHKAITPDALTKKWTR